MTAYIIRRLLLLPLILFGVTLIIFSFTEILGPEKMISAYVNPNVFDKLSNEDIDRLIEKYGLNDPMWTRYFKWLGGVLKGELGWSVTAKQPVADAIKERIPYTIEQIGRAHV